VSRVCPLVAWAVAHDHSLWQLVLVVIAIRTRNTIQVIAVTAFNFAFLAYAVIQVSSLINMSFFID